MINEFINRLGAKIINIKVVNLANMWWHRGGIKLIQQARIGIADRHQIWQIGRMLSQFLQSFSPNFPISKLREGLKSILTIQGDRIFLINVNL